MDDNANEYLLLNEPEFCSICNDELDSEGDCVWCDAQDDGDVGFMYEHDSSMASVGWGTDEDYGYYGDDE